MCYPFCRGFTPACIPSPLRGFDVLPILQGFLRPFGSKPAELERHPCLYSVAPSGFIRAIHFGSYFAELKYLKQDATQEEVEVQWAEALFPGYQNGKDRLDI